MTSDISLLRKWVSRRDAEAFREIVSRHASMVHSTCQRILGPGGGADDASQECFIRLSQGDVLDGSSLAGWLHTVATRCALDLLRTESRRKRREQAYAETLPKETDLDWASIQRHVDEAISDLPEEIRQPVVRHFLEGVNQRVLARELGITRFAVNRRIWKGIRAIRERLAKLGYPVTAVALSSLLLVHSARAAADAVPPALIAALGRIALSGVVARSASGPCAGAAGAALGGILLMNKKLLVCAVLLLAGLFTFWAVRREPSSADTPRVAASRSIAQNQGAKVRATDVRPADREGSKAASPSASITGRAVEALTERPVADIAFRLLAGGHVVTTTSTDAQGEFAFHGLETGAYLVQVAVDAGELARSYYLPKEGRSVWITLAARETADFTFRLLPASSIQGTVVDGDGRPVEGAALRLESSYHDPMEPSARSAADGTFAFRGVFPGPFYGLRAEATGYAPILLPGLMVGEKPLVGVVVRLKRGEGAVVAGRLVNRERLPIASTEVILSSDPTGFHTNAATGANGEFRFRAVPPGQVRVGPGMLYDSAFKLLSVKAGDAVEDIEIVVDQPAYNGSVTGTIVDAEGSPITSGSVCAQGTDTKARTVPDPEGRFRLANLKPGASVDILYQGWAGPRQPTDAKGIPVPSQDIVVTWSRPAPDGEIRIAVSGRVSEEETGEPIRQFVVCICQSSSVIPLSPKSVYDRDGRFRLENQPFSKDGSYVYVRADGRAPVFVPMMLDGEKREAAVEVKLGKGWSITGTVVDAAGGTPIEGARICMSRDEDHFAMTDRHGEFRLAGLPNVGGSVRVTHPGYAPFVGLAGGEAVPGEDAKEVKGCVVQLSHGGSIEGLVADASGAPAASMRVGACVLGDSWPFLSAYTDGAGRYRIDLVPPGRYRIICDGQTGSGRTIGISEGEVVRVDFGPIGAMVSGTVSLDGRPVPYARVILRDRSLYRPAGMDIDSTEADAEGMYTFHAVPPGAHYVIVCHDSRRLAHAAIEVEEDGRVRQDIAIRCGSLAGRVVRQDGAPVVDATVLLFDRAAGAGSSFGLQGAIAVAATQS
ncbi:MAG TPA: sigma-70 family RNA polymerase sigma factor, partial [Rectinemataceae bacterium]|nr:sigma-70 family RNA polymerase sigma factor [Rectinemataceae bacterium]